MAENLRDPLFLFFLVGLTGGLLKSDLKLPDAVYQLLSTYLLLAIGLKGGVQLSLADPAKIAWPAVATLGLGAGMAVGVFIVMSRLVRLGRADAAAFAAHYGSVSIGTFAVAVAYLARAGIPSEASMPLLLVVLEVPAILIGIVLARGLSAGTPWSSVLHEVLLGRSVMLLLGGLAIGTLNVYGVQSTSELFNQLSREARARGMQFAVA